MLFKEDEDQGGQGLLIVIDQLKNPQVPYPEPLINSEVGTYHETMIFLIDLGVSHPSLCYVPKGLSPSCEQILVSGVKGEGFSTRISEEAKVNFQNRCAKTGFLFVPESGTNLCGRPGLTGYQKNFTSKIKSFNPSSGGTNSTTIVGIRGKSQGT